MNLNSVVRRMEPLMRRVTGENLHLELSLDPQLGNVKADPAQMEQVIMNLVLNAQDAMPGGGTVTIETANVQAQGRGLLHPDAPAGRHVALTVRDTGVGMDQQTADRVFEPFFTTKRAAGGTGLGLASVYGIVKQSDGHIRVDSEPGKGTTFIVYLPRAREDSEVPSRAEAEKPLSLEGAGTVLLVEDEDTVRRFLLEVLRMSGYSPLAAASAEEAMEMCRGYEGDIDLMVTDVVMPRMSGPELAGRLSERWPDMKVLFISGYTDHVDVPHNPADPKKSFLEKPFTPEIFLKEVKALVGRGLS